MSKDNKELGAMMLILVFVCAVISYIARDPGVDFALSIILGFAMLLLMVRIVRKSA